MSLGRFRFWERSWGSAGRPPRELSCLRRATLLPVCWRDRRTFRCTLYNIERRRTTDYWLSLVKATSIAPGFLALLLTLSPALAANSTPDVHAIAQAVDNHYNHLRTLQAEFTESLPRGRNRAHRIGIAVAEKTRQDALGVPFSQGEALPERRQGCVVLCSRRAPGTADSGEEIGRPAIAPGTSSG